MSYIRIIEINSAPNTDLLAATLYAAEIDDISGAIISHPRRKAQGKLNIQTLVDINQQLINDFQTQTSGHQYFSSNIQLPDNMICGSGDPIDRLRLDIENLQSLLNTALGQSSWSEIREALLNSLSHIDRSKIVRLIIRTNDINLQSLPIEGTSFITNVLNANRRKISVIFDPDNGSTISKWSDSPKILLVFGSQQGIKPPLTENDVAKYFPSHAIITTITHPSRDILVNTISDESFDAIFIIAHSRQDSNGIGGRIDINDDGDSISINDWTEPFQHSVNRGLKLVVLAGCASVGIARSLASSPINIANVVSFRMPVHHQTLRHFLDRLLSKWITEAKSLEMAVSETRVALTVHNPGFPGGLPILFSSAYDLPLMFPAQVEISVEPISDSNDLTSGSTIETNANQDSIEVKPLFWKQILSLIKKICIKNLKILLIFLIGLTIAIRLSIPWQTELKACNSIIGDNISCGEEIFNTEPSTSDQPDKQTGASAIAAGDYPTAVQLLTKAWKEKQDPETLIMLENSKLRTKNLPIKSIALSIPGTHKTPPDISMAMLKAVAYAQQQWNANLVHKWQLQIVLADDKNNRSTAPNLARNVIDRGILATIGSYSSAVTLPAKDIYQQNKTVLLSGTSTATTLINQHSDTFFFRVCSNNTIAGKNIANYLKANKYTNIALFHTTGQPFSDSMTAALRENSPSLKIVKDFDFKGQDVAINLLTQAKQAGAQAIVLIPDAYTSNDPERNRFLSIIRENNGMLPIIGNEVIKDQTLFNYSKQQIEKVVISLTWDPSNLSTKAMETPGFWGDRSQLDHRLAMNYDAAQVLIKALDLLPDNQSIVDSRKQIQKILSDPNFSIDGITGKISFTGSERTEQSSSLVTPQCDSGTCKGFKPVTIK